MRMALILSDLTMRRRVRGEIRRSVDASSKVASARSASGGMDVGKPML